MTDKEVRKLNRTDLLKLLIEQTEENERLSARNRELVEKLAQRTAILEKSGSIAEAALGLSGVFTQAQDAADRYLASIRKLQADTEAKCAQQEEQTKRRCQQMEERTRALCAKLLEQTRQPASPPPEPLPPQPEQPEARASRFWKRR